ncbi:MAG: glycosyltransferase family 9 protein [Alphaproteobacteria bacterium]|nr:glycosyltransferase family 9 protein [Alphaproteobacteria bacterium]
MNRILIIQTASIGDVILATALVEKVHTSQPDACIDLLVKKGHETLFRGHPFIRTVLTWDKSNDKLIHLLQLACSIRKKKYDRVINIQRFFSTGFLTALSGARHTTGFSKNPFSLFFSQRVKHDIRPGIHEVDRNLVLLDLPDGERTRPRLYPTDDDRAVVRDRAQGPYYTISPASLWFTKQCPAEKWVGLMDEVPAGAVIYLLGSTTDQLLCESIRLQTRHTPTVNLAGKLTLLQSAALTEQAKMNFTNDSAPMHLCSAVNAPVTVVYCSTVPDFGFGPLSDDCAVVEAGNRPACRPCGLHGFRECPERHFQCATGIDTRDLVKRL